MKMKKIVSLILVVAMAIMCFSLPASAKTNEGFISQTGSAVIGDNDLFISEEAATYIAEFFIRDMRESEQTIWTSDTKIHKCVTMYDKTGENISAYTFELEDGYIVVSAYADVPSVILEWADTGRPVYDAFEADGQILYSGALNYFLDNGETIQTTGGEAVSRNQIPTLLNDIRSIDNVSPELQAEILNAKQAASIGGTASPCDNGYKGDTITDVKVYAANVYGGTWENNGWANNWESHRGMMVQRDVSSYLNACGPIAITNAIKMYGSKYNVSSIKSLSNVSVFNGIKDLTYTSFLRTFHYYTNAKAEDGGGTFHDSLDDYAKDAFAKYGKTITVSESKRINYVNSINTCTANNKLMLMYLLASENPGLSVGHIALGYAYCSIKCKEDNTVKVFVKMCDGDSRDNRFLDVSMLTYSDYFEIAF